MPITRLQARAAPHGGSSSIATTPSVYQEQPLSSDYSPLGSDNLDFTDETNEDFDKVRSILDIYQPNEFGPRQLSQAKDGNFLNRTDPITRIKTKAYMVWANAILGLAGQDQQTLNTLSSTMSASIIVLEECRTIVNEAFSDYSSDGSDSGSGAQARDSRLEEVLSDEIEKTKSVTDDDPDNRDAWLYAVAILLIILEQLAKRNAQAQTSIDTQLRLMEQATDQLKLYPEDVLREYAGSFRRITRILDEHNAPFVARRASIASTVKDIMRKLG